MLEVSIAERTLVFLSVYTKTSKLGGIERNCLNFNFGMSCPWRISEVDWLLSSLYNLHLCTFKSLIMVRCPKKSWTMVKLKT